MSLWTLDIRTVFEKICGSKWFYHWRFYLHFEFGNAFDVHTVCTLEKGLKLVHMSVCLYLVNCVRWRERCTRLVWCRWCKRQCHLTWPYRSFWRAVYISANLAQERENLRIWFGCVWTVQCNQCKLSHTVNRRQTKPPCVFKGPEDVAYSNDAGSFWTHKCIIFASAWFAESFSPKSFFVFAYADAYCWKSFRSRLFLIQINSYTWSELRPNFFHSN